MSRTLRTPLPGNNWIKGFKERMERGLVDIPKRHPDSPIEEIWGQRGKKFRKKQISKKRRRANKALAKNNAKPVQTP